MQIKRVIVECRVCGKPVGIIMPIGVSVDEGFPGLIPVCELCGQMSVENSMSPSRLRSLPIEQRSFLRGVAKESLAAMKKGYWACRE